MVEMEVDPPVAAPAASASTNGSGIEEDPSASKASNQTRRSRLSVASFPRGLFSSLRRKKVVQSADATAQDAEPAEAATASPENQAPPNNEARKPRSLSLGSFRFRRNVNRPKSAIETEPPAKGKSHKDRRSAPPLSPSTPTVEEAAVASTSAAPAEDKPEGVPAQEEAAAADKKKTKKGKALAAKAEGSSGAEAGAAHSKDVVKTDVISTATSAAAKNTKGKARSKSSSTEHPAGASASHRDPVSEAATAGESAAVNEQPAKSKGMTSLGRDFFSSFRRKKTSPKGHYTIDESAAASGSQENPAGTATAPMKTSRSLSLNSLRLKKAAKTQNKDKSTQLATTPKEPAASTSLVTLVDMGSSQTDLPAGTSSEAAEAPSGEETAPHSPKEDVPAETVVVAEQPVASVPAEPAPAQKEKARERFLFGSLRRNKKKGPSIEISAKESGQAEASAKEAPLLTPQPEPKPAAVDKKFGRSFSFNSFRLKKKTNKSNELKAPENSIDKSTSAVTLVSMEEAESKPAESENPAPANRSPHVKFKAESSEADESANTSADATDKAAAAEQASSPANDGKAAKEETAKSSADRDAKVAPPAENTALLFLKGIMDSPQKQTAAKVHNTQTNTTTTATSTTTTTTTAAATTAS